MDPASAPRTLRVVIAGGSGLAGRVLAEYLQSQGHRVSVLTRSPFTAPWETVHWDGVQPAEWVERLESADALIDLSGAEGAQTIQMLGRVLISLEGAPRAWLLGSTVEVYPHSTNQAQADADLATVPFSMRPAWRRAEQKARLAEDAFFSATVPGTRRIALRTGLLSAPDPDSPFARLSRRVRLGLGGSVGNGRQWVAWIHSHDWARAIEFLLLRDDLDGPINLTAPEPVRQRALMEALREAWEVPNGLPAPRPLVELAALVLGRETTLSLKSRPVQPVRLVEAGFDFAFPRWPEAALELTARYRERD